MSLDLMYITNSPDVARIADRTGVNRIFIDMEYIGKEERQRGMDSVKSHHTIDDIIAVKKVLKNAKLMARINPIHDATDVYGDSENEIDAVVAAGADVIMLPMYRTIEEVERFIDAVNGRTKVMLLAETPEACDIMDRVSGISEVDEIHLGLNDLHLAYRKKFMFELLADGTVDSICNVIKSNKKDFGFGGIARIGYGILPAEYIIKEHYRVGSTRAILSRAFCNVNKITDLEHIERLFEREMIKIREMETRAQKMSVSEFEANHEQVVKLVHDVVARM